MLDRLKAEMARRGISLNRAATRLGMGRSTLHYLLHDGRWPRRRDRAELESEIGIYLEEIGKKAHGRLIIEREVEAMERLSQDAIRLWGLSRDPFVNEIQGLEDVYRSEELDRCYDFMKQVALYQGFGAVVGEVGSGKTMLFRRLEQEHGKDVRFVRVHNTDRQRMSPSHIMEAVVYDLRGRPGGAGRSKEQLARYVRTLLADASKEDIRVCLVIDDAQQVPRSTLRSLKQLWEYECGFRRGMGILLLGQLELLDAMGDVRLRETTNRCATFMLHGLVHPNQVKGYLKWKLSRAGGDVENIFDDWALREIARHSRCEFQVNGQKQVAGPVLKIQNAAARLMNRAVELGEKKVSVEIIAN